MIKKIKSVLKFLGIGCMWGLFFMTIAGYDRWQEVKANTKNVQFFCRNEIKVGDSEIDLRDKANIRRFYYSKKLEEDTWAFLFYAPSTKYVCGVGVKNGVVVRIST